jgi:hypothetical protein
LAKHWLDKPACVGSIPTAPTILDFQTLKVNDPKFSKSLEDARTKGKKTMKFPAQNPPIVFFDFFGGTVSVLTEFEIFLTEVIDSSAQIVIKLVTPKANTQTLPLDLNTPTLRLLLTPYNINLDQWIGAIDHTKLKRQATKPTST